MKRQFDDDLVKFYFQPLITLHDTYDLDYGWLALRQFFAANAEFLTKLVVNCAMTPNTFDELKGKIKDNFSYTGESLRGTIFDFWDGSHRGDVFDPWAKYWCGTWKTDKVQYHLWDKTISWSGKYLQVVTQSEDNFVNAVNIEKRFDKDTLAINVSTEKNGITGWVTKQEKEGAVQIPHIGYLIDARILIWLSKPDPTTYDGDWNMFLEWTNNVSSPMWYKIFHRSFVVTGGVINEAAVEPKRGCAIYHNHTVGENKDSCKCKDHTCNHK